MPLQTTDVIVIGAGIAGVSCAARLAQQQRVLVLEAESHPGYHATGRSAAYFAPAYGNQTVREITRDSAAFFHSPPDGFTSSPLLKPRHSLFVADQASSGSLTRMSETNHSLISISGEAAREIVPILRAGDIAGALVDEDGGDLDVDAILQGFVRLLRQAGGQIQTSSPCQSLVYKNGFWIVNQTVRAPVVVNAAGAWADQIAAIAGLGTLGLTPLKRTAFMIDAPVTDIDCWPLTIDVNEQFYFKPDAGALLISPADEQPSEPCDAWADEFDIATAVDRVQQIADLDVTRVNHQWAGLRTFAPDRNFVVGFDPRAQGFFWLAGQAGYGVQTCPALSALAAAAIRGQHPRPELSPERFI